MPEVPSCRWRLPFGATFNAGGRTSCVLFAAVAALVCCAGCDRGGDVVDADDPPFEGVVRPRVVASTTIIADLVDAVAGDAIDLKRLMPPGADPHQFLLTARDRFELRAADIVFHNGLNLEESMEGVFRELDSRGVKVIAVTAGIPGERLLKTGETDAIDPHVWGDPLLWAECVTTVEDALQEIAPHAADVFEHRADSYRFKLRRLDNWIKEQVERVAWENPRRRILVTSHAGFGYWARAYQFEAVSLSARPVAGAEVGETAVGQLAEYVRDADIPTVFAEASKPDAVMRRVAAEAKVKVWAELYSDALGGDYAPAFELRLLKVRTPEELPKAGVSHIFLGQLPDGDVYIRVFNSRGQEIFDRMEEEISGNRTRVAKLKQQLQPSWEKGYVEEEGEDEVIDLVKVIIGYKPPARNAAVGIDPGPERNLPITGENIDVRTYVGMMMYNAHLIAAGLKAGTTPDQMAEAAAISAEKGLKPRSL